jgi:predicted transcriptional regulator
MSKILSLKLQEDIFKDAEEVVKKMNIPRNTFINKAIEHYTRIQKRKLLAKQLRIESRGVMADSMKVLKEFEAFTEDYE